MKNFVLLFLIVLPACTTDMQRAEHEDGTGQPMEYLQGHEDGCESGRSAADDDPYKYEFTKDLRRYEADEAYRQGWDTGYEECRIPD